MYPAKRIAVIGAGGKTTALARLAARCRDAHVLLTTTTHILPFAPPVCDRLCVTPDAGALRAALQAPGVTCAGMAAGDGKLTALPAPLWELVCRQADFIFYEADGAKRLPLKLHAAHEPVIQPETDWCLVVAGLSAWGKPVGQAVHRYALRPEWAAEPGRPVDAAVILACVQDAIAACGMPQARLAVLLNQADAVEPAQAQDVARRLEHAGLQCVACSLRTQPFPHLAGPLWDTDGRPGR